MSNINLYSVMVGDKPMVRYLMKQKGGNVEGKTSPKSAMWMLTNDKAKAPHMSEEFPGFPLTADGVYFFDGEVEDVSGETNEAEGATSSVSASAATFPSEGKALRKTEDDAPVCGPDYCDISELEEKPRRKKKTKDVVCE